jgi:hypothetical protein
MSNSYIKDEGATEAATVYTDFVSVMKTKLLGMKKASIILTNQHASYAFTHKILVSNDPEGTDGWAPLDLDGEGNTTESIAGEGTKIQEINTCYAWVDVQIESEGDGESPQATVHLVAVG